MSLEKFANILYKELPSKNLAFVEGGVLIYPSMIGLSMPLKMNDVDMYRYLRLFSDIMERLGSAQDAEEGNSILAEVAGLLEVDPKRFEVDNINLLMLESLLAKKVLQMNFKEVQKIYLKQKSRADLILSDLEYDIPEDVKKSTKRLPKSFTSADNSVIDSEQEELSLEPPYTQTPLPAPPSLPTIVENKPNEIKSSTWIEKTKAIATNPPILLGIFAIGLWAFTMIPKKKNTGYRS